MAEHRSVRRTQHACYESGAYDETVFAGFFVSFYASFSASYFAYFFEGLFGSFFTSFLESPFASCFECPFSRTFAGRYLSNSRLGKINHFQDFIINTVK